LTLDIEFEAAFTHIVIIWFVAMDDFAVVILELLDSAIISFQYPLTMHLVSMPFTSVDHTCGLPSKGALTEFLAIVEATIVSIAICITEFSLPMHQTVFPFSFVFLATFPCENSISIDFVVSEVPGVGASIWPFKGA
jgi:hypothetical protein